MISTNPKNLVSKLANAQKINYTPLVLVILALLQGVTIFQLLFQGSLLLKVKEEPASRFVELANGQTLKTRPISAKERSPEVIDKFTRTMMETLFSASNVIKVDGQILQESEVEINSKTITEKTAISLLFIEPQFLTLLLEDIDQATTSEIFEGKATRVLKIRYLSKPKKIENQEGYWELEMVANLYSYNVPNKELFVSKFNKKIQLRTVDYPTDIFQSLSLDLNQKILNLEDKEYLKQLFYELSNAGLEITLISEF